MALLVCALLIREFRAGIASEKNHVCSCARGTVGPMTSDGSKMPGWHHLLARSDHNLSSSSAIVVLSYVTCTEFILHFISTVRELTILPFAETGAIIIIDKQEV